MTTKQKFFSTLCAFSLSVTALQASHQKPLEQHPQGVNDYENSTWVEDWTDNLDTSNYIANLPRGVNTINVFVGQLTLVNGTPAINGYTLDTPGLSRYLCPSFKKELYERAIQGFRSSYTKEKFYQKAVGGFLKSRAPLGSGAFPNIAALTDFVKQCKASGCSVKLSIGGQSGTTFGNSWSSLSEGNLDGFAQALIDICNTTGADGIDFDYELDDTSLATLAGELAGKFRDLDTTYQFTASCCVLAGCDTSGPWNAADTAFLKAAVTTQGWCAIDRVYVMAYYDYCTLAQNEGFMLSWKDWLNTQHGFSSSLRISAGVDPNDPTTSATNENLNTWITFAQQHGFSTAIWDQNGVNDYVAKDWGTVIKNLYTSSAATDISRQQ